MQAGSERVKDTKAEKGMLKEASSINRSLFTLGKVWVLAQQHAAWLSPPSRESCCWAATPCSKRPYFD